MSGAYHCTWPGCNSGNTRCAGGGCPCTGTNGDGTGMAAYPCHWDGRYMPTVNGNAKDSCLAYWTAYFAPPPPSPPPPSPPPLPSPPPPPPPPPPPSVPHVADVTQPFVAKFDAATGVRLWATQQAVAKAGVNADGWHHEVPVGIATDGAGATYLTGYLAVYDGTTEPVHNDTFVTRLDTEGLIAWREQCSPIKVEEAEEGPNVQLELASRNRRRCWQLARRGDPSPCRYPRCLRAVGQRDVGA